MPATSAISSGFTKLIDLIHPAIAGSDSPFIPELGDLFDEDHQSENDLLSLLDAAYVAVRYGEKYHINKEQLVILFKKAKIV